MASGVVRESIQGALDEAGKVVKRQKTCEAKVEQCLDQLIDLVSKCRDEALSVACPGPAAALSELEGRLGELGLIKDMNGQTKDLHSAVTKFSKVRKLSMEGLPEKWWPALDTLDGYGAALLPSSLLPTLLCTDLCWPPENPKPSLPSPSLPGPDSRGVPSTPSPHLP